MTGSSVKRPKTHEVIYLGGEFVKTVSTVSFFKGCGLRFPPSVVRLCRNVCGVILLAGFFGFASPAVADSLGYDGNSVGPRSLSLWEKGQKAREYKREYAKLKESYEDSHRHYLEARQELQRLKEAILLHRGNQSDFQTLMERERKAWGRLYERDLEGEAGFTPIAPDPIEPDEPFSPGAEKWQEEAGAGFISSWVNRYRFWKDRIERIQEAHEKLARVREKSETELQRTREELALTGGASADARGLFEREMTAWRKLYVREDE
jgi:hypothetical protein